MLKTKCCKKARGTAVSWHSPKYEQFIEVQFCWYHSTQFQHWVRVYQQYYDTLEAASDCALEHIKPDQSRVAKRAGIVV